MSLFCHHRKPGRLKKFVKDLHSGKLHREFHHGPDPAEQGHEEEEVSEKCGRERFCFSYAGFFQGVEGCWKGEFL